MQNIGNISRLIDEYREWTEPQLRAELLVLQSMQNELRCMFLPEHLNRLMAVKAAIIAKESEDVPVECRRKIPPTPRK